LSTENPVAHYELRYDAYEYPYEDKDEYGLILTLLKDGEEARQVHVPRSGPEINGIARQTDGGRDRVLQALAFATGQFLEGRATAEAGVLESGLLLGLPYTEPQLRTLAGSDAEFSALQPGAIVYAF